MQKYASIIESDSPFCQIWLTINQVDQWFPSVDTWEYFTEEFKIYFIKHID